MLELLMSQLRAGTPPVDLDYDTMQALLAPDGVIGIQLGYSCSISNDGSIVALSAIFGQTGSASIGAVYIYEKTGNSYTWIQKLTPSDGDTLDYFGSSVAVSGDSSTVVVGAYGDGDKGSNSGSAYIFKYNGSRYMQVQKLTAGDGAAGDGFGCSVAVSGDAALIVIGSYLDDDKGTDSGSAYIFKHDGNMYNQLQKLTASDGTADDRFGYSSVISGDGAIVVIGSFKDDDKGSDSGSVHIFRYTGTNYTQVQKLTASDGLANDSFGYSVAVSRDGSVVVIGSYGNDARGSNSGAAYVFKYEGSSYIQVQKLIAKDGVGIDWFGYCTSVSGDGSVIIIASLRDDDRGTESGSVYIFKYDGKLYQEIKKLTGNKVVASGYFGQSVAIASDTQQIVVGANSWMDDSNNSTGAGFVFS